MMSLSYYVYLLFGVAVTNYLLTVLNATYINKKIPFKYIVKTIDNVEKYI